MLRQIKAAYKNRNVGERDDPPEVWGGVPTDPLAAREGLEVGLGLLCGIDALMKELGYC